MNLQMPVLIGMCLTTFLGRVNKFLELFLKMAKAKMLSSKENVRLYLFFLNSAIEILKNLQLQDLTYGQFHNQFKGTLKFKGYFNPQNAFHNTT
jgi:hypothetical protein